MEVEATDDGVLAKIIVRCCTDTRRKRVRRTSQ